jgi:hypothetical protein
MKRAASSNNSLGREFLMKLKVIVLCACFVVAPWVLGQEGDSNNTLPPGGSASQGRGGSSQDSVGNLPLDADEVSISPDLRQAALPDAHMVVYGKHNPERDYQAAYLKEVWQTVLDEKIGERLLAIVTSRVPEQNLTDAKQVLEELRTAIEPVLTSESLVCEESIYVQMMQLPANHQLVAVKLQGDGAEKIDASIQNLLVMLEEKTEGKVPLARLAQGDVEITSLALPSEAPFQPAYARMGNILIFGSHQPLLMQVIQALQGGTTTTKFDDPRIVEALKHLPEPEDALIIFDGQQMFKQLGGLRNLITSQAKDNPEALKVAEVMELVCDELAIIDYEVTVQYTEGYENRTVGLGKLTPDASEKLLGKLALGGEKFEDWQSWIPADSVAYSLSTGVRLHPAYEHVMEILTTKYAAETKDALAKFDEVQNNLDLYLDRDILQSFSGETVSITLPGASEGQDSFVAVKCTNPDRIRELLHRLVDNLNKLPALQAQQINLASVEGLDGFETLNVATLAAFNVKPVIGFHDGWMMIGSNPASIQKVLDARAGKIDTIDGSADFERFHLPVEGPVASLGFTDIEKTIHHTADAIRKVGGIAPMILAMAGANANAEELKPVFEAVAILPSIAKVVEKFDYYQASLTVIQDGPLPDSYLKKSVTLIRPPAEK